jgi:predicted HTH transcriptional regulator
MIADMFHRTGLIEKWGRGTNRVIDMCREAGISPPEFEEITGAAVVTFRVSVGLTEQVTGQVLLFCRIPRKAAEIQNLLHLKHRENFVENYLKPLLDQGWLERTIPDKPRSRLQRYRTTSAGEEVFKKQGVK